MTKETIQAKIAELSAQLAAGAIKIDAFNKKLAELVETASAAAGAKSLTFKISEKGAVSVYGLNARFPVSLYAEQWERLLGAADDLRAFLKTNADKLPAKGEKKTAPAVAAPASVPVASLPPGIDPAALAAFIAAGAAQAK